MRIQTVGTLEAKTNFSSLLQKVQEGQVFHIAKHGRIIAELRSAQPRRRKPTAGFAKGTFGMIAKDFDEPLEDFGDYMK